MKIPFSWLKEHTPLCKSPVEVATDLVHLGHEVESIVQPRAGVQGVRVGLILSKVPHPDADKLNLLQLDIGEAMPLTIVCGATNMNEGDKVPVATVGTQLPNGLSIKKGKIRGQESLGMCCSEEELGLADSASGLLILPKDAPIGAEVGEYLALEEAILELDITPNRGDCMSARGLARDLAADYALPFIEPADDDIPIDTDVQAPVVQVLAGNDNPLYLARRIEGVVITASPDWMQTALKAAGQRPVNGVVDVLNYTMLDLGQPMHAFDADTLMGDLQVRSALAGETFSALDGRNIGLNAGDLVVADHTQIAALAGIMGAEPTGVTLNTTNIILESAAFRAALISTTRRTHALVSEASMRFERGVDPAMIEVAMNQATQMIVGLFGGKASALTSVGDVESLIKNKHISVSLQRLESRLGIAIPESADDVLRRMGFAITRAGDILEIDVPAHRHDVSIAEDISEEYARVIGFDAIPATLPTLATIRPRQVDHTISSAVAHGFVQVITYAFISPAEQRLFVADDGQDMVLSNPISEAMGVMRRSVFPGLLNVAKHNMNRQQPGVALVEQGRVYEKNGEGCREINVLAWLMMGDLAADEWFAKTRQVDFFDLKGAVESWLANRGLAARFIAEDGLLGLQAGQTAKVLVGKAEVGVVGKVDADVAASFDVHEAVFVASIHLDALPTAKKTKYQPIPEFPSIARDLVFLFDAPVISDDILQTARKAVGQPLLEVSIFDWYKGKGVPEGQVSLGIRFTLQEAKRTLTQEDADLAMKAIVDAMQQKFDASLRG